MANTRFSTTTKPKTQSSGTSNILPEILQYPTLLPLTTTPSIENIFCYIIKHYGHDGLSVLIYRQPKNDQVVVLCGDWKGNKIDVVSNESNLARLANKLIRQDILLFYETMRLIRIEQAQFFFAVINDELVLVDVQVSLNKMASPGMVNDIFGKVCPCQQIVKTEIIDTRAMEFIMKGRGTYAGDLILKPSRFRLFESAGTYQPLYVELVR